MSRVAVILALAIATGGLALGVVRVDTDARALLGADAATAGALDTAEGRALTLAIVHPDRDRRSAIAQEIARDLATDPLVRRVTLAPAPFEAMIDWLWRHRFALAPPAGNAFTPAALSSELRRARAALTDAAAPFAGRYLLDPTGSFRRLVEGLAAAHGMLPVHDGVPQARDDSAALVFVELAERPFDIAAQSAFDDRLRARVAEAGAEALLVGPRTVSAATSAEIAGRATVSTLVASALLLLWLAAALRSAKGILACLLPAALGLAVAALGVQLAFGSVHVLALGFGGALMGLALDYPLHLMAHRPGAEAAHARRCVRVGAATTAIAFLALMVAGIPAIGQVGAFVAAGLATAAGAALWMGAAPAAPPTAIAWSALPVLRFRSKLGVLAAIACVAGVGVWLLPAKGADRLTELPARVRADISRLARMVDLPSGRHRVEVSGASLAEVLDAQARLAPVLEAARTDGNLARFDMLAARLPARPAARDLPPPDELSAALAGPLAQAGLRPDFRAEIVEAYREALAGRDVRPADMPDAELTSVGAPIRREGDGFLAPVLLWGLGDPPALERGVAALGDPAIRFVDQGAEILRGFERMTARVRLCVAIGAAAALGFLVAAIRRPRAVAEIAAGCVVAALLTAFLAGLVGGGIGLFHVMALALVIGIGIDYGLLLTLSGDGPQFGAAVRSVLLCATTTLIGFITMALSGVGVLEDIGTTVAIGVLAMLATSAVRSHRRTGAR
jgi:predicted exporter